MILTHVFPRVRTEFSKAIVRDFQNKYTHPVCFIFLWNITFLICLNIYIKPVL